MVNERCNHNTTLRPDRVVYCIYCDAAEWD